MSVAEQYFDADSFKVALNGVDQYPGFLDIIQSYKGTKAANLAQYYAGVCYAHLQQWNQAISHLKKFKTDDIYLGSTKYGLMGDCYMQMNKVQKAVEAYKKSVEHYQNHLTTPIYLKKLGLIYESLHQWKKALDAYNQIYLKYPTSYEARTIEKYIERVKLHMGQQ
jgi:tetratricopeptide (TPR) repeat protein